jgi:hypothetical protein
VISGIWNRRTWAAETQHLWGEGKVAMVRTKPLKSNARPSDQVCAVEEDEDCFHRRPIFHIGICRENYYKCSTTKMAGSISDSRGARPLRADWSSVHYFSVACFSEKIVDQSEYLVVPIAKHHPFRPVIRLVVRNGSFFRWRG